MKTIFGLILAATLIAGVQNAFANHIPMPNLPIGETANRSREAEKPCGLVKLYEYTGWDIWTLNGNWLLVFNTLERKIWVIKDLDGHVTEYYGADQGTSEDFFKKYPKFCDVVEK